MIKGLAPGTILQFIFLKKRLSKLFDRSASFIEVGSGNELISVLETVKKCVESGELDTQIESASNAVRERFAH